MHAATRSQSERPSRRITDLLAYLLANCLSPFASLRCMSRSSTSKLDARPVATPILLPPFANQRSIVGASVVAFFGHSFIAGRVCITYYGKSAETQVVRARSREASRLVMVVQPSALGRYARATTF